jgi:hypothetical protein
MSYVESLLQDIRRRPGMYIGWPSLSRLLGFLRGYDYALYKLHGVPADPFFVSFLEWIQQRLQVKNDFWENVILNQTGSEAEAIERFWVLLDEYRSEQGSGERQANGASDFSDAANVVLEKNHELYRRLA